jgi:DNA mismatch endonuclease, patch repair protein
MMVDTISKERRSWNMSHIRSTNTKPELVVRSVLHQMGFRFRLHVKDLPGKPDIVLPKYHTVIFVNGCFWHQHKSCKGATIPKTRTTWWKNKLDKNKERDKKVTSELKRIGYSVLVIWECETKQINRKELKHKLKSALLDNSSLVQQ